MIRPCTDSDVPAIFEIVNDAARRTKFLWRKVCFVTLPSSVGLRFTDRPSLARQGGRGTRCESTRVVLAAPIGA